ISSGCLLTLSQHFKDFKCPYFTDDTIHSVSGGKECVALA
ncbi:hypothetical protein DBR06_SOUSAS4610004, partial [Sousa chinensis]